MIIQVSERWKADAQALAARLERARLHCVLCSDTGQARALLGRADDTIIITDCRSLAAELSAMGYACIGCGAVGVSEAAGEEHMADAPAGTGAQDMAGAGFFDGAGLVTDDLSGLDPALMERVLLHEQGRPVIIARTKRLIIREITEADFTALQALSREPGMEWALSGEADGSCFEQERLKAYISFAYRFFEYGLWSVLLQDDVLIGCCGLGQMPDDGIFGRLFPEAADALELQYMIASRYQRKGYGTEMCRAVLDYAEEDSDRIWVRIHPDNRGSAVFAGKLGFHFKGVGESGIQYYAL